MKHNTGADLQISACVRWRHPLAGWLPGGQAHFTLRAVGSGWGLVRNDMIIYSGTLNNLSFSLCWSEQKRPRKFRRDRFISVYFKWTHKDKRFVLLSSFSAWAEKPSVFDPVSQDICHARGQRKQRIISRCVLNYSCHRAPNLCRNWSVLQNMKWIGVVVCWPRRSRRF